jgi:hypothetical protein
MTQERNRSFLVAGVLVGLCGYAGLGLAGLFLLRATWPAYGAAEPTKAYNLAMLLARLTVGTVCSVASGAMAAVAAAGDRRASWWVGAILLLFGGLHHLVRVWADYPAWYHLAFFLSLTPIVGVSGHLAGCIVHRTTARRRDDRKVR